MKLVNLTRHPIVIRPAAGGELTIAPDGRLALIATTFVVAGTLDVDGVAVHVSATQFGQPQGVPEPEPGVVFIVSTPMAQKLARADVLSPDTGPTAIREAGQVVAVRGLQSFAL